MLEELEKVFDEIEPMLRERHQGHAVLIAEGKFQGIYSDEATAKFEGLARFPAKPFLVRVIGETIARRRS